MTLQLKQLEAVKLRKAQQDQVVATKRKRLEDLQTQLVSLREAAHAIKDHLALPGVSAAERRKALASSALLPTPLYVLYHQLAAVKEASDERISITVTGDLLLKAVTLALPLRKSVIVSLTNILLLLIACTKLLYGPRMP